MQCDRSPVSYTHLDVYKRQAMHTYEAATAALAGLSATAAGILAQRRRAAALAEAGPDASRTVQERLLTEAQAAVVDEIRLCLLYTSRCV